MSITPPEEPAWSPPSASECEEAEITYYPRGADPRVDRVKIRMRNNLTDDSLVGFAIVQETPVVESAEYGGGTHLFILAQRPA